MSDYTITLKRCSEIYGRNEIISWFYNYNIYETLTIKQAEELMRPIDLFGNYAWSPEKLAEMIFEHYLMREIAFETPELFRHYAKVKMQEIMPKYLLLLWSASVKYNPLEDNETFNITETFKGNKNDERNNNFSGETSNEGESRTTGASTSSSTSSSSGLQINNDTPQGNINKQNILNGSYASSTSANESEGTIYDSTSSVSSNTLSNNETKTNNETSKGNQDETYTKTKSGFDLKLSNMEKIMEYRKTIENYNLQIIEECNSLFFALY